MKKNHSKRRVQPPASRRAVKPETEATESTAPTRRWKPIKLEDLNLSIVQMIIYAEACRPFADPSREDDQPEPGEEEPTNTHDRREPRP